MITLNAVVTVILSYWKNAGHEITEQHLCHTRGSEALQADRPQPEATASNGTALCWPTSAMLLFSCENFIPNNSAPSRESIVSGTAMTPFIFFLFGINSKVKVINDISR
jgi:hypothetical protein